MIAKFYIEGNFSNLDDNNFVLYGYILEGMIKRNNFIVLKSEHKRIKLKINSIRFVDKIDEKTNKIELIFYNNDNNIKDLKYVKIEKQIAIIDTI